MNVSLIINESQVANGSVTMVTCIGEVVKLDVGDTGMKRVPKTSRNLDFCNIFLRKLGRVPETVVASTIQTKLSFGIYVEEAKGRSDKCTARLFIST